VVGTPDTATVTITDDPPVVNVVATDPDAAEAGADPGVFMFQRTGGNLAAALTVRSTFSGTAANAGDFVFISALVTILAAETSGTLTNRAARGQPSRRRRDHDRYHRAGHGRRLLRHRHA
jgi:hypothetical protein